MSYLWDLSLSEVVDEWDRRDRLPNGKINWPAVRALCQEDRYYLLIKACGRKDALHPWIYDRCREVERAPDDHLDLWGREMFKSTLITITSIYNHNSRRICVWVEV